MKTEDLTITINDDSVELRFMNYRLWHCLKMFWGSLTGIPIVIHAKSVNVH